MTKKILMSCLMIMGTGFVAATPRNVVVILVDDLGWSDIACNGSTFYDTPNIDKLARQGVRFTDGYAAHPVCSPTRAAIMTGKNPCRQEVNITDWIPGARPKNKKLLGPPINNNLPLEEVTIAETLREAGYSTWFLGKWHLGETETHWPKAQGFDVNFGGHDKGSPPGGYYSPYKNPVLEDGPEGEYLTDRLTSEAIRLVKNRDKQKPFLLYLSYYTVHTPIQACKHHLEKYEKKLATLPKIESDSIKREKHGVTRARQDNPAYASMVYAMDENVGRLMETLKEQGLDENTIVFFTGDNGGLSTLTKKPGPTCETPLRAGKGWTYEGGIRVPYIVRNPGASANGTTCDVPVVNTDFYATILDCCGIPLKPELHKDSVSIQPLLNGAQELKRTEPLVWHFPHYHGSGFPPGSCIREGDWKLVESYHDETVELYNLRSDQEETKDLAGANPEKTVLLRKKMHDYLKKTGASMASVNASCQPENEQTNTPNKNQKQR